MESGACIVKYDVTLKDATGKYYYKATGYNIRETKICNLTNFADITNVEMIVSFKNITSMVSKAKIITPSSTSPGMNICL